MTALGNAKTLWDEPEELIAQWESDESKTEQENLTSEIIGKVRSVVDLGCGAGRYFQCLQGITKYQGYDQSSEMILYAKSINKSGDFACIDITKFQTNEKFDTGICIDVAYHQEDPIEFIETIFKLWKCKRLFFTMLVGDQYEELYNSVVVERISFERLIINHHLEIRHIRQLDSFDWLVLQK